MSIASISLPAGAPEGALLRHARSFVASFRWALEVKRRCDHATATGRRLDGATIRRIAQEADEGLS